LKGRLLNKYFELFMGLQKVLNWQQQHQQKKVKGFAKHEKAENWDDRQPSPEGN
jgi:hypothetical protein